MPEVVLQGLSGLVPRDVLAAHGVLAALSERPAGVTLRPPIRVTLRWDLEHPLTPRPVIVSDGRRGVTIEALVEQLDADREAWPASPLLDQVNDITLTPGAACRWVATVADTGDRSLIEMVRRLVLPDPLMISNNGIVRRTALRFASGQQRWLTSAASLAMVTTGEHLLSAVTDGTVRDDTLPSMRWGVEDDRQWALTGSNPATTRAPRPVGKEWLAWRGLAAQPPVHATHAVRGLRWHLHTTPKSLDDLRQVNARLDDQRPDVGHDDGMVGWSARVDDSHGYGHFSPPTVIALTGSAAVRRAQFRRLCGTTDPPDLDLTPVGMTEVAELLNVELGTVVRWGQRRLLPPGRWRVGGRRAWALSDITHWAQSTGRAAGDKPKQATVSSTPRD